MSQLRSLRRVTLLVLLLVVAAGPGWAEYCKSQGSPRIPKSQIGPYDAAALLSTTQIIDSEAKHLPWGRPACSRILFHIEYVSVLRRRPKGGALGLVPSGGGGRRRRQSRQCLPDGSAATD